MNFDGGVQFMKWGKQSLDQCFYFDIWCAMKLALWFLLGNAGPENLDPTQSAANNKNQKKKAAPTIYYAS